MPLELFMKKQGADDVPGDSLTASNPLGSGGRLSKRQRGAADAAAQEQQQQEQQKALGGTAMHLRSAQKRLLAAEVAARADSAVDSSQQLDRTDSCGGPRGGSADARTTAAAPPAAADERRAQQSHQQGAEEATARVVAAAAAAAEAHAPPAKRRRVARTGVPAAMPAYELRRNFDRPSPPLRDDDENGHYQFDIGENLAPRFKIMRKFGEGTFGQVLECWDRKRKDYVAVKVIRNIQKYRDAAMIELEALATLAANDPTQAAHCVRLLEWFDYRGHVCMVFERLGPSLYDLLRRNGYKPFPLPMVQAFIRQLLESVAFMHENQIVHTDLKPENILVLSNEMSKDGSGGSSKVGKRLPASTDIRVIDFGSATFDSDYHSTLVSTRHYRAPEVILGLGWSFPCDIWSLGCILVELLTGDALFQTHENMEHLAMMEAVLEPLPADLAAAAAANVKSLFKRNRLNWPDGAESKKSIKAVQKLKKLHLHLRQHCESAAKPHLETLTDLIQRMLAYRAADRITAAQSLRHAFFQLQL